MNAADREVHRSTETLAPAAFGTSRTHDVRPALPLDRLEPGPYLLRVHAAAEKHERAREDRFFLRPR